MIFALERGLVKDNKLVYELLKVFGLGRSKSKYICGRFGLSQGMLVKDIDQGVLRDLFSYIERNFMINYELRNTVLYNIQFERTIKSYKGYRRFLKLPVRGQRTKSNAKTAKRLLSEK